MFLTAFFLYSFAMGGVLSYLGLYMKRLGESPMWISDTFAVGVISEVLVMVQIGRLSDRFGRRPALAVAFLALPLRLLLYIPATGPLWILCVHAMHGLNFGIMGAIAVVFVNDLATNANRGVAQARLAGAQGLAASVAPMAGGFLADRIGMGWMFAVMSAVSVAAAVLFLTQVHESHPSPESLEDRCHPLLRPFARLLAAPR
jgi:MFS family permease